MISAILNLKYLQLGTTPIQTASLPMAILFLLFIAILAIILVLKVIRPKRAVANLNLHKKLACIYDGLNMRSVLGKSFILVPYIQKTAFAAAIVLSANAETALAVIVAFKLMPYLATIKHNPFNNRFI